MDVVPAIVGSGASGISEEQGNWPTRHAETTTLSTPRQSSLVRRYSRRRTSSACGSSFDGKRELVIVVGPLATVPPKPPVGISRS